MKQVVSKKQRKASRRRNVENGTAIRQAIQRRGYQGIDYPFMFCA